MRHIVDCFLYSPLVFFLKCRLAEIVLIVFEVDSCYVVSCLNSGIALILSIDTDRKSLEPDVLCSTVICHVGLFCPAYSGHILSRLFDVKHNCIGISFADAVGSHQPYKPAIACYRQNCVVIYRLPCAVFTCRADLKITSDIRISCRNYLRKLERYRLSECELVNRTYLTDLRYACPDSVEIHILIYAVELLSRFKHAARAVCLGIPSHENETVARDVVHEVLYHISEVRNALAFYRNFSAGVLMVSDNAALSRNYSCAPVLSCLLYCKPVAAGGAVSVDLEVFPEKDVGEPAAFCEHPVHIVA